MKIDGKKLTKSFSERTRVAKKILRDRQERMFSKTAVKRLRMCERAITGGQPSACLIGDMKII